MLTRLRRRLGDVDRDGGFSLADLLVGSALLLVVCTLATTMFVGSSQATSTTTDASLDMAQARTAVSNAVTLLQFADSPTTQPGAADSRFATITATNVVFYSNATNRSAQQARTAPVKVSLALTGGQLVERLYRPIAALPQDWTTNYPSTASSTSVLANGVDAASSFAYCSASVDGSGNCITTTSPTAVASVVITLVITGRPGERPQTLVSTAAITGALQ